MEQVILGKNTFNNLSIEAFPRIHITLLSMCYDRYRMNGGIGFSIEHPCMTLRIRAARDFSISDDRITPMSSSGIDRLRQAINKTISMFSMQKSVAVEIVSGSQSHFGFGTGTSIRLASLEALFLLNNVPYDENTLRRFSGRGRTSGIGVNTYFHGGIILDLGHKAESNVELLPSNAQESQSHPPLLLNRNKMPLWPVGICIPSALDTISEPAEKSFFESTCPIRHEEVDKTVYDAIFGLYAAILEDDFETWCEALRSIQTRAWKKAERNQHGAPLADLERTLYTCGAEAVGVSSMGPLLYYFAKNVDVVRNEMLAQSQPCHIICTYPRNLGRIIKNA